MRTAVEQLLEYATFAEFRRNVSAYKNYAIFEVPLILDQMMAEKAIESMGAVSRAGDCRSVCQCGLGRVDVGEGGKGTSSSSCRLGLRLVLRARLSSMLAIWVHRGSAELHRAHKLTSGG